MGSSNFAVMRTRFVGADGFLYGTGNIGEVYLDAAVLAYNGVVGLEGCFGKVFDFLPAADGGADGLELAGDALWSSQTPGRTWCGSAFRDHPPTPSG